MTGVTSQGVTCHGMTDVTCQGVTGVSRQGVTGVTCRGVTGVTRHGVTGVTQEYSRKFLPLYILKGKNIPGYFYPITF
jgi:hypothetical protein